MAFKLRDYQIQAAEATMREFESVRSTLVCCPTGTGKSVIASEVVKRMQGAGACLFLAHREELLHQAQRCIESHCGVTCEYELGDLRANAAFTPDVLLASVQSLISGRNGTRRMTKFSPYDYGLIVVDEFHHSVCASYKAVLDYFSANTDCKVLGITATPERADEEALAQVCESVAFDYPIMQAVNDGWLVAIQQQLIDIQGLDFSHVRTTAGDLNLGDLGAIMEEERNLYGICDATHKEIGNRKAIMFTVTVRQAEQACKILNRYRDGMAAWASGKTPKDERRHIMKDFADGKFQVLVNCNLVSEGFDVPDAELLIQARPTKSKLLYQQQLGRIMRPLSGVVDSEPDAPHRLRAIADSPKPIATVMDFVGNAGRHKLVHAVDVLGGTISDKAKELAERELRRTGRPQRVDEMVIEAERREREARDKAEAAHKAKVTGRAQYTIRMINPFDAFDLVAPPQREWNRGKSLSEKQRALLLKQGINPDQMPYVEAKAILDHLFYRWAHGLCSLKQANLLKRRGVPAGRMTREEASKAIDEIAAREGWNRR